MSRRAPPWIAVGLTVGLAVVTVATYRSVLDQPFLGYDDAVYVVDNPAVNGGLSVAGLREAFLGFHAANWHPVTWLSHQLDVSLFGLDASAHHRTNLLLHLLNVLLLFFWLDRAVGPEARRRNAFVAAVFALHPLGVDSVAWIAERKNLLATGFGFATLLAWTEYARSPSRSRYLGALALFGLGAMSKPMLVVLPGILWLVDYWPLSRWPEHSRTTLIVEKLPLLAVSFGTAGLTVLAQGSGGAVESLEPFPIGLRLANAVSVLPTYLGLVVWPAWPNGLAILHPHPGAALTTTRWVVATAVVALFVVAVIGFGRRRPYLWVGAAWAALGLLPVIGLVQVGAQSHAERYAYFPMVGVVIGLTWWASDLARERRCPRRLVGLFAVVALLLLGAATRSELRHWRDEIALFSRAVELHERSGIETRHAMILYYQLGVSLQAVGRDEEAVDRYRLALLSNADDPRPHNNLGSALASLGRFDEAAHHYAEALRVAPAHASALYNLAHHEWQRGDPQRARSLFARFLERGAPDVASRDVAIRGLLALDAPRLAAAAALQVSPPTAATLALAAEGLSRSGRSVEARVALERALTLDPTSRALRNNLAYRIATTEPDAEAAARAVRLMEQLAAEAPLDAAELDTLEAARAAVRATR